VIDAHIAAYIHTDNTLNQAKGFPDLTTRRFLSVLHSVRPELDLFALVDFDPHGIAILRTYKYGSQRFGHEEHTTVPRLRWLGIRSHDLLPHGPSISDQSSQRTGSSLGRGPLSQGSIAYSVDSRSSSHALPA
jgi:meiotic recombination protein SPO11